MAAYDQVLAKLASTTSLEGKPIKKRKKAPATERLAEEPSQRPATKEDSASPAGPNGSSKALSNGASAGHTGRSSHLARFARRRASKNVRRSGFLNTCL